MRLRYFVISALAVLVLASCGGEPQAEQQSVPKNELEAGRMFLASNGQREGVVTLPSGVQYEVMKAGDPSGPKPTATSQVVTHYHGILRTGEVFDSSVDKGAPVTFMVGGVIPGWQEVLQLMTIGDKWRVYIPSELAYGKQGRPKIPGDAVLLFEIELMAISG